MSGNYAYTRDNLLTGEPLHYHYTPFKGTALLSAWREDRVRAISKLKALAGPDVQRGGLGQPSAMPSAGVLDRAVETGPELAAAVAWVRRGGDPEGSTDLAKFVDVLICKFEVAKRLRSRYGPGLRTVVRDSAPLDAYAHLAFLVAQDVSGDDRLWRLNALLKLNDLIVSTAGAGLTGDAAEDAVQAIAQELEAVELLGREKGVGFR